MVIDYRCYFEPATRILKKFRQLTWIIIALSFRSSIKRRAPTKARFLTLICVFLFFFIQKLPRINDLWGILWSHLF